MDYKETTLPAVFLVLGIVLHVVLGFWLGGVEGAGLLLLGTLVDLVIRIPLGIIACLITASFMGVSFGTVKGAILKLGAIFTLHGAVLLLVVSVFGIQSLLLGLLLGWVLYWGLLASLFELEAMEVIFFAVVLNVVQMGASFVAALLFSRGGT